MRQFARAEILERLRAVRARGEPLVLGGAGTGLVAKAADRAGIDVLMAYNTGPFRMDGQGSLAGYLAYGDANGITLELGRRLLPVVEDTPVVGGIGAADPYRDVERLLDESWPSASRGSRTCRPQVSTAATFGASSTRPASGIRARST